MTEIGFGEIASGGQPRLPLPGDPSAGPGAPCASGRCKDGSPCRRMAALIDRLTPRVMEETEHG